MIRPRPGGYPARVLGAVPHDDGTVELTVWAPDVQSLAVHAADGAHPLDRGDDGVHVGRFPGRHGDEYFVCIDEGTLYPDPCSRAQPYGVRGASAVVDATRFEWTDGDWTPPSLDDLVIYELHIGTFSETGTLESAIDHLDEIAALGVNAIEVMPVAEFPGQRGWGYDGVYISAAQSSYGGPLGSEIARTVQHPPVAGTPIGTWPFPVRPGTLTARDIANYRVRFPAATHSDYRGLDVYGMSTPSSGGTAVAEALNILEQSNLGALPLTQAEHRYLEASALAFADRNRYVGNYTSPSVLRTLASDRFARSRACLINPAAALMKPLGPGGLSGSGCAAAADTMSNKQRIVSIIPALRCRAPSREAHEPRAPSARLPRA